MRVNAMVCNDNPCILLVYAALPLRVLSTLWVVVRLFLLFSGYLDNTAFEITNIRDYDIQLRDPTLLYPIFRAENKANFERMLEMLEMLRKNSNNSKNSLRVPDSKGGLYDDYL